jgi:SSS family solute:Na+ symporter
MKPLDWIVISVYMVGMLAVGWYYARRAATAEDYLLGGRRMRPLGVGLSLFASLLSTITYLSLPGEMIKHGPMMLTMVLAFPLVVYVVGWFMIPFIMALKVTSAYEILETRLGLGVRMLGATFFLSMRLAWMAVIIYATTDKILVPLLGLERCYTPVICAILGVITVVYTSMGGLRAVVFTDVTQTLILFGGAVLTLVLISIRMKGVGSWWPEQWPEHWQKPEWGLDLTTRTTLLGAVMAQFTWWVCTAGSDQMAIQRYLATRDVKTARSVLITSLCANAFVYVVLFAVGLALLAFFAARTDLLPAGETLLSDPDKLFPHFIAHMMPAGISGLVVAGLLAAAMSSLSSGVNSSCSVITADFIDRFRRNGDDGSQVNHVRRARIVSAVVGAIVVGLSTGVGMVKGNLLEVAFKVVNLLTAPLFGLFFMAMFVRWATGLGTIVGAVFGVIVVAAINYWPDITGQQGISFLWAMPLSFLTQITVGMLVSLFPTRRRGAG